MPNNQIQIAYNPYKKKIQYRYRKNSDREWEPLHGNGKLTKQEFCEGTLQNKASEIIQALLKDYCAKNLGLELHFRGTRRDWEDFKTTIQQIDLDKKIVCVGEAGQLSDGQETLVKVEKIFRELKESFDNLSEPVVKEPINKYLETVRPEVVLCVIGTYSSGKSTFINALIGEELMPSAADPTTAKIFKIQSLPKGTWMDTEIRFQYQGENATICFQSGAYELKNINQLPDLKLKYFLDRELSNIQFGQEYICQTLTALNKFDESDAISDQIEIQTPFYYSSLPLDEYQFIIYDTPGSNANSHKDHFEILKKALSRQTNGLPIFLTSREQMDTDDADSLKARVADIPALDNSNILIVVNKADDQRPSELEGIKKSKSVVKRNAETRVFVVSSLVALGAKTSKFFDEESKDLFEEKSPKFKKGKLKAFEYDILPQDRYKQICEQGESAINGNEKECLFYNSGLGAIENEIAQFARKFAVYNKCRQAQLYLSEAIDALKKRIANKQDKQSKCKEELEKQFSKKEKELKDNIEEECKNWEEKNFENARKEQGKICTSYCTDKKNRELSSLIEAQWKREKKKDQSGKSMEIWAKNYVNTQLNSCIHDLKNFAYKFWKEQVNALKEKCIFIVHESDGLTQEERDFLSAYILEMPLPKYEDIDITFSKEVITENRFLFFKWISFNSEQAEADILEKLKDSVLRYNAQYLFQIEKKIKEWRKEFNQGLTDKMAYFNPNLRQLNDEIKVCDKEIKELQNTQEKLEDNQKKMNSYFEFVEEE